MAVRGNGLCESEDEELGGSLAFVTTVLVTVGVVVVVA